MLSGRTGPVTVSVDFLLEWLEGLSTGWAVHQFPEAQHRGLLWTIRTTFSALSTRRTRFMRKFAKSLPMGANAATGCGLYFRRSGALDRVRWRNVLRSRPCQKLR